MKQKKALIFIILSILVLLNLGCGSNLTAETAGQITGVTLDRERKTTRRKTSSNKKRTKTTTSIETEIEYRYTVGGKTFEGFSEKDGDVQRDFSAGAQVVVCYNPSNPEESDVFVKGTKCG